jgi:hypothetical protein
MGGDHERAVVESAVPHPAGAARRELSAVHRHADAVAALRQALSAEPDPGYPKLIRWWLSGGPRADRARPRPRPRRP